MRSLRIGLIGAGIGRSRLARALDLMCADHGIALDFTPIDTAGLAGFDFAATIRRLRDAGWHGVTVTHPYKTHAFAASDRMAPGTGDLGAANTLLFRDGDVLGTNTDYSGFRGAWTARMAAPPGRVAMAGAGGVARAVAPALRAAGAEVTVWDRDAARARALAAAFGLRAVDADDAAAAAAGAAGLVNCTPLGMGDDGGSAFPLDWIGPQRWAFDAVYTPTDTPFLRRAADEGLTILSGFDLFRHMAMDSFAAYTGIAPDPATTLPRLQALRPGRDPARET